MGVPKPPTIATSFLFLIICISFSPTCCLRDRSLSSCPEIEMQSLLTFKQSLEDPSNLLSFWNASVDCCRWRGVICNNLTGHVHQLHLQCHYEDPNRCLSGKISPSLLNLKHLRYLNLGQNNFDETIPAFIGSLTSLGYLDLSSGLGDVLFPAKIPESIGNLSNLYTLILGGDLFVDSLEWLWRLSKLEHLNMYEVDLSMVVSWEQVIDKLPSLVDLNFSSCILSSSSSAPPLSDVNISRSNLATLDLSFNSLAIVPEWIFHLTNLSFLDLSFNSIQGPIPTNANCTKLRHINLFTNHFETTIPGWLYSCKDLEVVHLGENNLEGEISNDIANLTSLTDLDLSYNELYGEIPKEIGDMCRMQRLDISYNKLGGEISNSFGNMSDCFLGTMEWLNLIENKLSGHLTHRFGEFKRLSGLNLKNNSLSGIIPGNIANLSSLEILDLSYNSLSGAIPTNIGNLSSLTYLNLGCNSLLGVIPSSIGNLSSLEYLILLSNRLNGSLPDSIGQLTNLKELDIGNNKLEGVVSETNFAHLLQLTSLSASGNRLTLVLSSLNSFPSFRLESLLLGSWNVGSSSRIFSWIEKHKTSISALDLSCTGISDDIPSWLWSISYLNLSHNQLHGKIPLIGSRHSSLYQYMYLSGNSFSCLLPRLGGTVHELDLSNNSFSGGLSQILCDTPKQNDMTILDLEENNLSGELPDCWMNWPSLKVLNLGNNNLSGRIPNSIGSLANLLSLNLYGNKFSGRIPLSFQNCTQLLKVDLARNSLDGNIPTWTWRGRLIRLRILILRSNELNGVINPTICQLSSLRILDLSNNKLFGTIPRCIDNFTAMTTKRILTFRDRGYSTYWRAYIESASC